jgi:hypothetical protein
VTIGEPALAYISRPMLARFTLRAACSLVLLSASTLLGCFGDGDRTPLPVDDVSVAGGQFGLDLNLPVGADASEVAYAITRSGVALRAGIIATSSGRARMQLGNLPPAQGYVISVHAEGGDRPACDGEAMFDITAGETTKVAMTLRCAASTASTASPESGTLDGTFNYCPSVPTIVAAPNQAVAGEALMLTANVYGDDALSFAWSAASGAFSSPDRASTMFTCSTPGAVPVIVSVRDAHGCSGITGIIELLCTGPGGASSAPPAPAAAALRAAPGYLVALVPGVITQPLLTAGESPSVPAAAGQALYRMVGMPDGLGAFDNDDGTFTLLSNHALGNTSGRVRAHAATGAFVSRWTVRKSDRSVLGGEDLIRTVNLWDPSVSAYVATPKVALARLSAADLPAISATWHIREATGFKGYLFFNGEASGHEGRALAHGLDGVSYELPRLGKASWQNLLLNPFSQQKTVLVALDGSTLGHVYLYVGNKTNSGSPVDRAGLTAGTLYGVAVSGNPREPEAGIANAPFALRALGNVENLSGAQLDETSAALGATYFNRLADGAWDPGNVGDFYFVTTNAPGLPSRLWRLRFSDITQPELGGSLQMLLDGSEGQVALTSLASDGRGHLLLEEDPGNDARLARIFRYTIASDGLAAIAQHSPALFSAGAASFITQDEEASGVIDATGVLGPGWWLTSDQVHAEADAELVEGGQYSAIYDPGTL